MKPTNRPYSSHRCPRAQTSESTPKQHQPSVRRVASSDVQLDTKSVSHPSSLDDLYEELKNFSQLTKHNSNYNWRGCGSWSKKLRNTTYKKNISPSKIEKFTPLLLEFIKCLPRWESKNLIDTFRHLVDVGFFSKSKHLKPEISTQVSNLENSLLTTIENKIYHAKKGFISLTSYIYLYGGIAKYTKVENHNKDLVKNILEVLVTELENNIDSLYVGDFKEISYCTKTLINNTRATYKSLVQDLIENSLYKMSIIEKTANDESDFYKFFNIIYEFIFDGLPVYEDIERNFCRLFSKLDLNTDLKKAILATNTMIKLVFIKNVNISLNILTENKIYQTCAFIEKNHSKFTTLDSLLIASFISKIMQIKNNNLPSRLTNLLKISLNHLNTNAFELSTQQSIKLSLILSEFCTAKIECSSTINSLLERILEIEKKILMSDKVDLHCLICNLSKIFKKLTDQGREICKKPHLTSFIKKLIQKHSESILDAPLANMSNSFLALSELASSGFLLEKNHQEFIRKMYSILINQEKAFTDEQAIDFVHSSCMFGNLINLDLAKQSNLFKRIFFSFSQPHCKLKKKLTYLWCLIVFSAINEEQLKHHPNNQLNREIFELFSSIQRRDLSESYAHQIFTTAENWLKKSSTFINVSQSEEKQSFSSPIQLLVAQKLREHFGTKLRLIEEFYDNDLPPCDIGLPDQKIIVEVQGVYHYLDDERKCQNGSTILKRTLYNKRGYKVIEIQAYIDGIKDDDITSCIKKIETVIEGSKLSFSS